METPDILGSLGSLNPFANINLGSIGSFATILLVFFIAILILGIISAIIYINVVKKQYWIRIHLFKNVGNVPTRIAIYCAKPVKFGMAGDSLWRVAPNTALGKVFQIVKWLPAGRLQTARNEYWYWMREDGEWVNFIQSDIDEISKKAGVKFVKDDMRLQRLAIERLLEQRLMNKSFWDKWGNTIMTIILFLIIAVAVVIIFYQFGKIVDKLGLLIDNTSKSLAIINQNCFQNQTTVSGLVPVG